MFSFLLSLKLDRMVSKSKKWRRLKEESNVLKESLAQGKGQAFKIASQIKWYAIHTVVRIGL